MTESQEEIQTQDVQPTDGPQEMLDKLVGRLSFDPLEFMGMDNADQLKMLKDIAGL